MYAPPGTRTLPHTRDTAPAPPRLPRAGRPKDGVPLATDPTVDEISERLDGLSAEELKKVREYEKRNKNRETLIEQIDRRIRANS